MINIVLAADNNYIQHCVTTLTSILENSDSTIDFFILTSGFTEESISVLTNIENKYKCKIAIIYVNNDIFKNAPLPESLKHINLVTYYRILIPQLLPENIHKVIYLDCDIVVRKDIKELWEIELGNVALGAVFQTPLASIEDRNRLNISDEFGYFNAGVLLINLTLWRNDNIMDKCMHYMSKNRDLIIYHDQDILNAVLFDNVVAIPFKWNMMTHYFFKTNKWVNILEKKTILEIQKEQKDPSLIHYVFVPKPWDKNCDHPFKNEYFYYATKNNTSIRIPQDDFIFKIKQLIKTIYYYFVKGGYV